MVRFTVRVLGLWLLAGGFAAAVIDGMKSIAAATLQTTSALATWQELAPGTHAAAHAWIERTIGVVAAAGLDAVLAAVPTWTLLGSIGAVLVAVALPRDEASPLGG
jgi:hypothetical protein